MADESGRPRRSGNRNREQSRTARRLTARLDFWAVDDARGGRAHRASRTARTRTRRTR